MYSKKGEGTMEQSTVMILLVLIGGIVIFLAVVGSVGSAKDAVMHKMCTWSLVFKDKFILGNNLCYTDDKEVKGSSKDEVMKDVADKMVECWERMDEGRTPIDKNWFIGGHTCFKCYRLKIPNLKEDISYEEFYKFLRGNEIKGSEESYYDFFKRYDEKTNVLLIGSKNSNDISKTYIDSDNYYAVAFKGEAPTGDVANFLKWAGMGAGTVATITIFVLVPPTAVAVGAAATAAGVTTLSGGSLAIGLVTEMFSKHDSIIFVPYGKFDEVCPESLK
jgi:hypothetical protein